MRRTGFTLVEAMIAGVLLTVVTTMLWTFLSRGMKREARLDFSMAALQTALAIKARIGEDFNALIPGFRPKVTRISGPSVYFDRAHVDPGVNPLDLSVEDGLRPSRQTVSYRFDPKSRQLLRNGQPMGLPLVSDATFTHECDPEKGFLLVLDMELAGAAVPKGHSGFSPTAKYRFTFRSPQGTLALAHGNWIGDAPPRE